jgi:hypothetical protein
VEYLLERCIPEEDFLRLEDFSVDAGSLLINGSEKVDFVDRTATDALLVFRESKEKRIETFYREESNETEIKGYMVSKQDQFECSVKEKTELLGITGNYMFLRIGKAEDYYILAIYDEGTRIKAVSEYVYGVMIKDGWVYYLKEVQWQQVEHLFAQENCMYLVTDELGYKRCGVYKMKIGVWEESFTNQVFCVQVKKQFEG